MNVTLFHCDGIVTHVDAGQDRAPWTTCPGAIARVKETFTGVALKDCAQRGEKKTNCTHLHDLAVIGAAHALDQSPFIYDVLVSDPIDGTRRAELRRDGVVILEWVETNGLFVAPEELRGKNLLALGPWINSLDASLQEPARVLRWGSIVAHGRTLPMEYQSDAARMPPNCYTFQPEIKASAKRVGEIRDFSNGTAQLFDRRPVR